MTRRAKPAARVAVLANRPAGNAVLLDGISRTPLNWFAQVLDKRASIIAEVVTPSI